VIMMVLCIFVINISLLAIYGMITTNEHVLSSGF
jgi:uncharacterized membrane protein (Fun14 family)